MSSVFAETLSNVGPVLGYQFSRPAFQKHLKKQYSAFKVNVAELERTITEQKVHSPVYQLSEAILWLLQVRYSFRPLVTHALKGWITQDVARIIQPKWMMKALKRPMRYEANRIPMDEMLADRKACMKPYGPLKVRMDSFHTADAIARTAEVRTGFRATAFTLLEEAATNSGDWQELVECSHALVDGRQRNTVPFQISKAMTEFWDGNQDTENFLDDFLGREPEPEPEQGELFGAGVHFLLSTPRPMTTCRTNPA